jgi:hypothetical protein
VEKLDAVADRGYFNSEEIRACEEAGITVTLPKPMTSNAKAGTVRNSVCEAIMMEGKGASYGYRERPAGPTFSWA